MKRGMKVYKKINTSIRRDFSGLPHKQIIGLSLLFIFTVLMGAVGYIQGIKTIDKPSEVESSFEQSESLGAVDENLDILLSSPTQITHNILRGRTVTWSNDLEDTVILQITAVDYSSSFDRTLSIAPDAIGSYRFLDNGRFEYEVSVGQKVVRSGTIVVTDRKQ